MGDRRQTHRSPVSGPERSVSSAPGWVRPPTAVRYAVRGVDAVRGYRQATAADVAVAWSPVTCVVGGELPESELAGLRGLRRGELCGLRWPDIDLDRGILTIERNRTTAGYHVVEGQPKTPAGRRSVALDERSVQILRVHRRYERDRKAEAAGERYAVD